MIAILLMNEPPNLFTLTGAAAILAGATIVYDSSPKPHYPPSTTGPLAFFNCPILPHLPNC